MKKVLIIVLSLIISLSLVGCVGNSDTTSEPPTKPTDEPKEQVDKTPPPEDSNANSDTDDSPQSLSETAQTILQLLKNKDMKTLSTHVHPEHGLLFSPYVYVNAEDAILLKAPQVKSFFADQGKYLWGVRDGSGEPIELTPSEYYEEFIYNHDYHSVDPIIDEVHPRGNAINNIKEVFPEATVVEFHVEGTEKYSGMDWGSLNLVFQEDKSGVFYLVAIVHDRWTI